MKAFTLFNRKGRHKIPATNPLENIRVAYPCPASWEKMIGDERVRHCQECNLNVYNLSEMTRIEAERLIANHEGRLCVRFYRRTDGTMLTQDCPRGLQAVIRRVWRLAGAALAATMSINLSGIQGAVQPGPQAAVQANQELGSLDATVTDPTGAAIANAQVTFTDKYGKQIRLATDSNGQVHFVGLVGGEYKLSFSARHFQETQSSVTMQKSATKLTVILPLAAALQGMVVQLTQPSTDDTLPNIELAPYKLQPIKHDKKRR